MMQVAHRINFDQAQYAAMVRELDGMPNQVKRAVRGAVNDTTRNLRTEISTWVRRYANIKKRDVDRHIRFHRFNSGLSAEVIVEEHQRPPLKYFGARQTRAGVSYRIRRGGGVDRIAGAFMVDALGGHVFRRAQKWKHRFPSTARTPHGERYTHGLPIVPLKGVSPWGVMIKQNITPHIVDIGRVRLRQNLIDRLRYMRLKREGAIGGAN